MSEYVWEVGQELRTPDGDLITNIYDAATQFDKLERIIAALSAELARVYMELWKEQEGVGAILHDPNEGIRNIIENAKAATP